MPSTGVNRSTRGELGHKVESFLPAKICFLFLLVIVVHDSDVARGVQRLLSVKVFDVIALFRQTSQVGAPVFKAIHIS